MCMSDKGSSSCTTSSTLGVLSLFSQPNRYEVVSHCGFNVHFPMINDLEHLFKYLFAIHISLLDNMSCLFVEVKKEALAHHTIRQTIQKFTKKE